MRGAVGLLLGLILLLGFGYFCYLNVVPVSVRFWPGMPPRSAFIWEIAAYSALTGTLIALLLLLGESLGTRRRFRQMSRRIRELEARLQLAPGAPVPSPLVAGSTGPAASLGQRTAAPLEKPARAATAVDEEPV